MLSLLKSIIVDFQEMDLQTGIPRKLTIEALPGKATICTGVRRSGKSTYMFQILKRLIEKGISRKNLVFLALRRITLTLDEGTIEIMPAWRFLLFTEEGLDM